MSSRLLGFLDFTLLSISTVLPNLVIKLCTGFRALLKGPILCWFCFFEGDLVGLIDDSSLKSSPRGKTGRTGVRFAFPLLESTGSAAAAKRLLAEQPTCPH